MRAIQLIVSHDAIAVSAEKDKGFYRDKLENKLNIDLEVHMALQFVSPHIQSQVCRTTITVTACKEKVPKAA